MEDYRLILKRKREALGLSQHTLEQFFRICEALEIKVFPEEE